MGGEVWLQVIGASRENTIAKAESFRGTNSDLTQENAAQDPLHKALSPFFALGLVCNILYPQERTFWTF